MRKCFVCKSKSNVESMYVDLNLNHVTCKTPECMSQYSLWKVKKVRDRQDKAYRKETRRLKDGLNDDSVSFWVKKVQERAFNPYIRKRDKNDSCMSCGRSDSEIKSNGVGGKWDAGHFKSRGAYPELRFEPLNCHKQCKSCNGGAGKFAKKDLTVTKAYRIRLIDKIGLDKVEWLEGPHKAKRYRVNELKELYKYWIDEAKKLDE